MSSPKLGRRLSPLSAALALLIVAGLSTIGATAITSSLAEEPTPTVAPSIGPIVWTLPESSWGPLSEPSPTLIVTPAPTKAIAKPAGAAWPGGRCAAPNMGDRRAGNSPDAQAYLRSRLTRNEYNCAWWIVMAESSWRAAALNWQGACGFPQASPCSKLADWLARRHPDTCEPTTLPGLIVTWACDWRAYPLDQIDWLIAYVRSRYGSFWSAAAFKFGYTDSSGAWHRGHGWY